MPKRRLFPGRQSRVSLCADPQGTRVDRLNRRDRRTQRRRKRWSLSSDFTSTLFPYFPPPLFLPWRQLLPVRISGLYTMGIRESQMAIYASLAPRRSLRYYLASPGGYKRVRSFRLSRIWFIGWLTRVCNLGNRDSQISYKVNVFSNDSIRNQPHSILSLDYLRHKLFDGLTRTRGVRWTYGSKSRSEKHHVSERSFFPGYDFFMKYARIMHI